MKENHKIDGRYVVIRDLGKGMSGQVVLVADGVSQIALKFLNPLQMNVSRGEALHAFKNEFSILKELNHPNISKILDFGFDEALRRYYFTTEFVAGLEFHKACEGLPFETVEKLVVQVLRALSHLHSRGIYHFDIKPQNILVAMTPDGPETAKLIDFGLAGFATPGKKVGTPAYMAPEAIQGGLMDGRTDLYSFGVMLYKMLTGTNPFVGKTLKDTLDNQLHLLPSPASQLNSELPKYWDHILDRLLQKNPANRYSQAAHVIRDLNFISGKKFEVETSDSKLSYLPERGALIGREAEWQDFVKAFGGAFHSDGDFDAGLMIVQGEKGTGKTRFLSEIKSYSQLKGVPVRHAGELSGAEPLPSRFLLLIDNPVLNADEVNTILQENAGHSGLVVWATERAPQNWAASGIITLKNYSPLQLKQYIESVTGLRLAPETLITEVYGRTQGNPLLVTEYVKALLNENLIFDASGKWDAHTFDDIQINFSKLGLPSSIEDYLLKKLSTVGEKELAVLQCLAVNGAPLDRDGLAAVLGDLPLDEVLLGLIRAGHVDLSEEGRSCGFKNPLMGEIILQRMSAENKTALHAKLADWHKDGDLESHLFHRAHAVDEKSAAEAMMKLGELYLASAEYDKAVALFRRLTNLTGSSAASAAAFEAHLKLVKALVALRDYEPALKVCQDAILCCGAVGAEERRLWFYQEMIDIHFKRSDVGEAQKHLADASALIADASVLIAASSQKKFWELLCNNNAAYLSLKKGRTEAAKTIYKETYEAWKRDLPPEQQLQVTNNRLVQILLLERHYEDAIQVCQETLAVFEKTGDKYQTALHFYNLGNAYYQVLMSEKRADQADITDKALHAFRRSESLARELRNHALLLRVFNAIGMTYLFQKDRRKAVEYYERALAVARKIGEMEMAGLASYNIATIFKDDLNPREAYSYLVYALNTFEGLSQRSSYTELIVFMSYLVLAEVSIGLGAKEQALAAIAKADVIFQKSPLAKSRECRRSLVMAQMHHHDGEFQAGQEWLAKAKSQAVTPEQKGTIAKYEESRQYRELRAKAVFDAASALPQLSTTADNPAALIADQRAVIRFLCELAGVTLLPDLLRRTLTCVMTLSRSLSAGFLRPTPAGPFDLAHPESALGLSLADVDENVARECLEFASPLLSRKLAKTEERVFCLRVAAEPGASWVLYCRRSPSAAVAEADQALRDDLIRIVGQEFSRALARVLGHEYVPITELESTV